MLLEYPMEKIKCNHMRCLRGTRNKIKHSLRIRHIRNRINLKRMNHIWELHRITNKENFKLFPTKSQLPSSVYIFTAKPRGSLAVSGESLAPATVEKRTINGVFASPENTFARVYFSTGSSPTFPYVSKYPNAPAPRACTTRSGTSSRSK